MMLGGGVVMGSVCASARAAVVETIAAVRRQTVTRPRRLANQTVPVMPTGRPPQIAAQELGGTTRRCSRKRLLRPCVVRPLPRLVGVVGGNLPDDAPRVRPEILLKNDAVVIDDEGLPAGDAVLRRRRDQCEPAD